MVEQIDRIFSESIEIGQANQRLLPRVKGWCRHINVEMTSSGLLGPAMGLPIGHLQVTCPHGITLSESAHLSWEANSFILRNCVGCPHHDEVSADNYGREVLAEKGQRDREEAAAEDRRKELKAQEYEAAATALKTGQPTEESVNRFILDLFGTEVESGRSKDLLVRSAELGSECFSDAALRVMADAFAGPNAGSSIEAARIVCKCRGAVPSELVTAALKAVEEGIDPACGLLSDAIGYGQEVAPILSALPSIIALAGYGSFHTMIGGLHERPYYPGTVELLGRLFKSNAESVRASLVTRLKSHEKLVRFNAIRLATDLLPGEIGDLLPLADELLRSLELPDDFYDGSADRAACRLIAHLYAYSPAAIEARIQAFLARASQEASVVVLDIYSELALLGVDEERERWPGRRGFVGFDRALYARYAALAIDRLLLAVADLDISPDRRFQICDKLKHLIKCYPGEGVARIDRILGRLAMTVHESRNSLPPDAGTMAALEAMNRDSSYGALKRYLAEIVDELARVSAARVFAAVRDLLDRLSSKDGADAELKAQLVTTLSSFAESYEMVPLVIRQIYKHLVDFESMVVRSRAIRVAGDLLSRIPESIPDDIVELLTIYLTEDYCIIHQNAIRALASYKFQRDERGNKALTVLIQFEQTYRLQPKETAFLGDILSTLRRSFREWPEVRRYIAVRLLPEYSRLPDRRFAEDMLVLMGNQIAAYPKLATPYVRAALDYLKATNRDRYDGDIGKDRGRIRERLLDVPSSALAAEIEKVRDIVRLKAARDPFDVIHLLEILSFHELHADAAGLAEEALGLVPEVKSLAFAREAYAVIQTAADAEVLVAQGRPRNAARLIEAKLNGADRRDPGAST